MDIVNDLIRAGKRFDARGWVMGTSGNFSAVLSRDPLRLAITSSGVDKGSLSPGDILEIDQHGGIVSGSGRPSAEAALHLAIVRARGAGAVLHTHSVWGTILSDTAGNGLVVQGYEMLKGLDGVASHEHREWLPVIENTQNWEAAAPSVTALLDAYPDAHALLIRSHGLYTW